MGKAMIKKVLIGIGGGIVVLAFIGWQATVAVHDRKSSAYHQGSLNTLLDLFARFLDTGNRAKAAYDKGDYATARKLFQNMAERGNSDAMLRVAVMDMQGKGGPVDNIQAVKWFRILADRGDREAQFALGLAYGDGSGVEQDYAEALRWYQKSAGQGSAAARVNLGVMYLNGQGVAPNRIEAQKWFILAGQTGQKNRAVLDRTLTADENAQSKKSADAWKAGK
jgi:TPR repeat protein